MRRRTFAAFLTGIAFTFGMIILIGAGGTVKSPTGTAPDRYVYYPGTEELGKDEIRLIAAGTGMPGARRGQAATCFLVELGDGDNFLFDVRTGSADNLCALRPDFARVDKAFANHLHTDHVGDVSLDVYSKVTSQSGRLAVAEAPVRAEEEPRDRLAPNRSRVQIRELATHTRAVRVGLG